MSATKCECTIETGCGEDEAAGCDYCRITLDIYDPCPVFGFICQPGGCDCCTEDQQIALSKWRYQQ